MSILLGTALLVAAAGVLVLGHLLLNRPTSSRAPDLFGAAEAIAFLVTALISGGIALLVASILRGGGLLAITEAVGGIVVAVLAGVGLWMTLRRYAARGAAEPASPLPHDRRGRPGPEGRPTGSAGGKRARKAA